MLVGLICSTFPGYTVEAIEALGDLNPVMRAMHALGIYNGLLYGKEGDKVHIEATWADWERRTGKKRPPMKKTGSG